MTLTVTVTIQGTGITSSTVAKALTVDAIDEVIVDVDHGAADQLIDIYPGAASLCQFVLIKSDTYPETVPGTPDITYKPHSAASAAISLGTFHIYMPGQDDALPAQLDKIYVSNAHASTDVVLSIICGRNLA